MSSSSSTSSSADRAVELAFTAWDAATLADRAAYDRCSAAYDAVTAARAALAVALAEHEVATTLADKSFAAREAAFQSWDSACNARNRITSA
jgi:hypothetical protein